MSHLHLHMRQMIVICIVGLLLLIVSLLAKQIGFESVLRDNPQVAIIIYVLYVIISTVITTLPIVPVWPVAYVLFGFWPAVISTLFGVIIGSSIAFLLTRKYGKPFVESIIPRHLLKELDHLINGKNTHSFLILRIFGNNYFDIISYAAGLSKMSFRYYVLVTAITSGLWTLVVFYVIGIVLQLHSVQIISAVSLLYIGMAVVGFGVWRTLALTKSKRTHKTLKTAHL